MNWFNKTFKRNWETIFYEKSNGVKSGFFGLATPCRIGIVVVVQVDKERNKWRSFITDGQTKEHIDINFLISYYPELKDILEKNNIKY